MPSCSALRANARYFWLAWLSPANASLRFVLVLMVSPVVASEITSLSGLHIRNHDSRGTGCLTALGDTARRSVSRRANPGTDSQFPANCAGNLVSVPGLRCIAAYPYGSVIECALDGLFYPKPVRAEYRNHQRGPRVQLGPRVVHLAAYVRPGMLRHRDDRRQHLALRYRALRRRSLPSQPAAERSHDRRRHRHPQDGARAQTHLGSDAGPQMVHLHGRLLERRRTLQHLRGADRKSTRL